MVIIISLIILAVLLVVLFAPVKAAVLYKDGKLSVVVFLYGIKAYEWKPKKKSAVKKYSEPEEFQKDAVSFKEKIKKFTGLYKIAVKLLKKYVSIKSVRLNITAGTSDAAVTAVTTGALWAAVYGVLGLIGRIMYIDEHKVNITPDYAQMVFRADGECIIKSRVVYIIIIAITILMKINPKKGKEE